MYTCRHVGSTCRHVLKLHVMSSSGNSAVMMVNGLTPRCARVAPYSAPGPKPGPAERGSFLSYEGARKELLSARVVHLWTAARAPS